jgi:hypothetical protein
MIADARASVCESMCDPEVTPNLQLRATVMNEVSVSAGMKTDEPDLTPPELPMNQPRRHSTSLDQLRRA